MVGYNLRSASRALVLTTIAAFTLTAAAPAMADAAPIKKPTSASAATSDTTDISAARRYRRGYGGGAAAAAAIAGVVGTGLAIAATRDRGYYGDGYYGRPYGYGNPYGGRGYGYGPGYYRGW